ncbi:MAG: hypothetical protein ABIL49_00995 [candidate division WOR-3 bacterium]
MKGLNKAIENYLKLSGLEWILDYIDVKEIAESVLKSYDFVEFEDFKNGILFLKVKDKRKIMEFHYKKFGIIKAINTIARRDIVKDIVLK